MSEEIKYKIYLNAISQLYDMAKIYKERYNDFDFLKQDPSRIIYIADTTGQFNLWRQRRSQLWDNW